MRLKIEIAVEIEPLSAQNTPTSYPLSLSIKTPLNPNTPQKL